MSTRSKSGSAPKAKEWKPEDINAWMLKQAETQLPVAPDMPKGLDKLHQVLTAQALHQDPTPLPVNPLHLPLLP